LFENNYKLKLHDPVRQFVAAKH